MTPVLPSRPDFVPSGPKSSSSSSMVDQTSALSSSAGGLLKKEKTKISIALPTPAKPVTGTKIGGLPAKPIDAINFNFETLQKRAPSPSDRGVGSRNDGRDGPRGRERERNRDRHHERGRDWDRDRDRDLEKGEGPSSSRHYISRSPTPPPRRREKSRSRSRDRYERRDSPHRRDSYQRTHDDRPRRRDSFGRSKEYERDDRTPDFNSNEERSRHRGRLPALTQGSRHDHSVDRHHSSRDGEYKHSRHRKDRSLSRGTPPPVRSQNDRYRQEDNNGYDRKRHSTSRRSPSPSPQKRRDPTPSPPRRHASARTPSRQSATRHRHTDSRPPTPPPLPPPSPPRAAERPAPDRRASPEPPSPISESPPTSVPATPALARSIGSRPTPKAPPTEPRGKISIALPAISPVYNGLKKAPPTGPRERPPPPLIAVGHPSTPPTRPSDAPSFKPIAPPPPEMTVSIPSAPRDPSNAQTSGLDSSEAPPPPSASVRPATVPSPPSPPQPAYEPPPYIPPPAVHRRPGLGNFLVTYDPATASVKTGKQIVKRFDGGEGAGVKSEDPRLKLPEDIRMRGRGTRKLRAEFHSLSYEWNENSFGVKPPPLPCAVLITHLNPLTTVEQISKYLRTHGKIREMDSKMDTRSGMQLGICWVKFEGPVPGKPGSAHDIAKNVVKTCDGQRVGLAGDEKIKVMLDGRGLRAEKAVKDEMARRYPPKTAKLPAPSATSAATPASTAAATPVVAPIAATPASSGGNRTPMAPPAAPKGPSSGPSAVRFPTIPGLPGRPRPSINFNNSPSAYGPSFARSAPARSGFSIQSRPVGAASKPVQTDRSLVSSFIDAPFAPKSHLHKRLSGAGDTYSPRYSRSRSRSRSRSHSPGCSTCDSYSSDSDDGGRYRYGRRRDSPAPRSGYAGQRKLTPDRTASKADEDAAALIKAALASNGRAYILIDSKTLPAAKVSDDNLRDHFRAFKPTEILSNNQGRYILFADDMGATRAGLLNDTQVKGFKLVLSVKQPTTTSTSKVDVSPSASTTAQSGPKGASAWKFLTFTKKGGSAAKPAVAKTTRPDPVKRISTLSTESDSGAEPFKKRNAASYTSSESSDLSDDEVLLAASNRRRVIESPDSDDPASTIEVSTQKAPFAANELIDKDLKGKKRPAKPKGGKVAKKSRLDSPTLEVDIGSLSAAQPAVAEIQLDTAEIAQAKVVKPKKPTAGPVGQLIASGDLVDEEDAYWLGQALKAARDGVEPDFADDEGDDELDKKHPLHHSSGAWRAEGWKKVPQVAKSVYLPQRNRAVVSTEDAGALTSGRSARVTGRRLALDMETQRKTIASSTAESDLFAFNQLRIRKKQLRFARSAIEGYGLYAMETIQTGEMICEYVGEICRSAVAEIREQRYLKQGIGSSYLFRIDNDLICDATFRGSVSRLINHSCDPSANAKIISINGHSKIVIYARRQLHPGEEILYDYKFPLESDPALRVPCLCGAATCRGWLN